MEPQQPYIIKEDYDVPAPPGVPELMFWQRANVSTRQVCELHERIADLEREVASLKAQIEGCGQ